MSDSATTTHTNRTRSQTTLDQFAFNLAASPLKQAKSALKHAQRSSRSPPTLGQSTAPSPSSIPISATEEPDIALNGNGLKRPPSPAHDTSLPDLKRPRHDHVFPPSALPDRHFTSSVPATTPRTSPARRAISVPPLPPIPLLDLNNVPPSPRRSPPKLRITSLPPEPPPNPSQDGNSVSVPIQPPILPLSLSPLFSSDHATPIPRKDGANQNGKARLTPFMTPMSPLTPLPLSVDDHANLDDDHSLDLHATRVPRPAPPLPALAPITASFSQLLSVVPAPMPGPSSLTLAHPARSEASRESMLPRPAGVKARMKPRAKHASAETVPPPKKVRNPRDRKAGLGLGPIRSARSSRSRSVLPDRPILEEGEKEQVDELQGALDDIIASPRALSRLQPQRPRSQSRPPSSTSTLTTGHPLAPRPTTHAPPRSHPTPSQAPSQPAPLSAAPKTPRARVVQLLPRSHTPSQPSQPRPSSSHASPAHKQDAVTTQRQRGRVRSQSHSYAQPTTSSTAKATPVKPASSTAVVSAGSGQPKTSVPTGPFDFRYSMAENRKNRRTPSREGEKEKANGKSKGKERASEEDMDEGTDAAEDLISTPASTLTELSDDDIPDVDRAAPHTREGDLGKTVENAPTPKLRKANGRATSVPAESELKAVLQPVSTRVGGGETEHVVELTEGNMDEDEDTDMVQIKPSANAYLTANLDSQAQTQESKSAIERADSVDIQEDLPLPTKDVPVNWDSVSEPKLGLEQKDSEPNVDPSISPAGVKSPQSAMELNSSLLTLNEALERLNAPPPSRPNTSMGFHRSLSSDGDNSFEAGRDIGAGFAAKGVNAKCKGKVMKAVVAATERPSPSTSMLLNAAPTAATKIVKGKTTGTTTAVNGQKRLKQTTLMLPPPTPAGTRTTRLRAARAAQSNANATAGRSTPTPSAAKAPATAHGKEQEKMRQLTIPLSHSLAKMRNGFASAQAPVSGLGSATAAGPSSSSSSTLASTTAAVVPASLRPDAAVQSRIFPPPPPGAGRGGTLAKPLFGVGRLGMGLPASRGRVAVVMRGRPGGSRVTQKASKATSLPIVEGSPVKGGGAGRVYAGMGGGDEGVDLTARSDNVAAVVEESTAMEGVEEMTPKDQIGAWLKNASKDVLRDIGHDSDDELDGRGGDKSSDMSVLPSSEAGPLDADADANGNNDEDDKKVKERESRRNMSRRASMASHLLTQSLSALPETPPAATNANGKGKERAVSSTYPSAATIFDSNAPHASMAVEGEGDKAQPTPPVRRATRLATGALFTPPNAYKERSLRSSVAAGSGLGDERAEGKGKGKEREKEQEKSQSALDVLKDCKIFVDVRTDEGDDAGGLFVDMLKGLGAKIATRVGSRCTHVVFKNGLVSTLSRYKTLSDPKPHVVGIAWVVECAEQRTKVDESRFSVNLSLVNIAGVNKRRKSMLPKHYSPVTSKIATSPASSDSSRAGTTVFKMSIGGGSRFATSKSGEQSLEVSPPPMAMGEDADSSVQHALPSGATADDDDSLPPLEKARRRRSMLPIR